MIVVSAGRLPANELGIPKGTVDGFKQTTYFWVSIPHVAKSTFFDSISFPRQFQI